VSPPSQVGEADGRLHRRRVSHRRVPQGLHLQEQRRTAGKVEQMGIAHFVENDFSENDFVKNDFGENDFVENDLGENDFVENDFVKMTLSKMTLVKMSLSKTIKDD
jgi:hypothetical protein